MEIDNASYAIFYQTFEQAHDAIITIDAESKEIFFYNQSAERMFGYNKVEVVGQNISKIIPFEYYNDHDGLEDANIKTGRDTVSGTGRELEILRKNGEKLWVNITLSKVTIEDVLYFTAYVKDISNIIHNQSIPFHNPNPILQINYNFELTYFNHAAENIRIKFQRLLNISSSAVKDKLSAIIDGKMQHEQLELKIDENHYIFNLINQVDYQFINIYGLNITGLKQIQTNYQKLTLDLEEQVEKRTKELNNVVEKLNVEIRERLKIEKGIKHSLNQKEVLLNEISHRVKNNLQVVSSLLSLQKDNLKNEESIQLLKDTGNRIKAMALIHEALYKGKDFSVVNFKDYVEELIYYIKHSYMDKNVIFDTSIENISLNIDSATSCGMILMEIISNSFKYAFLEGQVGIIKVRIYTLFGEKIKIEISDDGIGFPNGFDSNKSVETLGMQLIKGLVAQLKGEIIMGNAKGAFYEIVLEDTKKEKDV